LGPFEQVGMGGSKRGRHRQGSSQEERAIGRAKSSSQADRAHEDRLNRTVKARRNDRARVDVRALPETRQDEIAAAMRAPVAAHRSRWTLVGAKIRERPATSSGPPTAR